MKKTVYTALLFLLIAALLLPLWAGCAAKPKKYTDQSFEWFDSYYILTVYAESEEEFNRYATLCRSLLSEYHQLLDVYHSYDGTVNLKSINDATGTPIAVSPELFEFLRFSREMYTLTNGYTNIAMGGVIALWHQASKQATPTVPDQTLIAEALNHTDINALVLSEDAFTVTLSDPLMSLNAGALGKGYASQKIAEALRHAGCTSFLLDLGGNVVAYGQKPYKKPWTAGIRTPDGHVGYEKSIDLNGTALVTSGSYERYFEADGVRYHHILHPESGLPPQTFVSVSVLCESAAIADALSTALFSMTLQDGMALVDSLANTEAIWFQSDGQTVCSHGFETYGNGGKS